jgi:hypothetical protein
MPPKICNHRLDKYVWRGDVAALRICAVPQGFGVFGCGAVLPLGPSNDAPEPVRIEMRAANLAAPRSRVRRTARASTAERAGWHANNFGLAAPGDLAGQAGWLARAIDTHDPADVDPEIVDVPAPADLLPDLEVETDALDGTDQGEAALPAQVELAEAVDVHDEPTDPGVAQEQP